MKIPIHNHELVQPREIFFFSFKDECSFVSLRDVERAMQVMVWFYKHADTLGRLMRKVAAEKRREEGVDVDEDDDEEVVMNPFDIFSPTRRGSQG